MVAYHYDFRIALVKGSPNTVAANATVLVYDPLDTGYTTPLSVYSDPALTTIVNLVTDQYGIVPDFWTNNKPDLLWKSGTMKGGWATTSSRPGIRGPSGGTGPQGPRGPQGTPGLNGAGTNADIATYVEEAGPTKDALDETYATRTSLGLKIDKASPAMALGQDLNLMVTTGNWNVQSTSVLVNGANYPVQLAGMLSVVARSAGDSLWQRYKAYATGEIYERTYYGLVWSAWTKVVVHADQLFLSPKAPPYNAKGNGVADDSTAIQAWLNDGGVVLANGTFRITTGLTLSGDNRTLYTDNATILADSADITALTVTGNKCRVSVRIDGNNKANFGIRGSGAGCVFERNHIENIYSSTTTARAMEITTTGGAVIRNNTFRNVTSVGNVTFGDGNGFARAIVLYGTAAATATSYILDNVIDNIVGEEGDGIAVLFFDGSANPFLSGKTTVRGNQISNVSRRFIKIQGSDVRVEDNILTHDGTVPANPSSSIDLIQCDNVTVARNTITPNPLSNAIASNGTSAVRNKNLVIEGNIIRQGDTKNSPSIYLNYATESSITGNTAHGGAAAVLLGNSINVLISDNKHFGGLDSAVSFSANSTNTGVVMRLNTNMKSSRTNYISNLGAGALTELNATRV